MPIPDPERARASLVLENYCDSRIPADLRDRLQLKARFEGTAAVLIECRPSMSGRGKWTESPVARFRYFVGRKEWELQWIDRNDRWHRYEGVRPSTKLERLLAEVDRDPTCIFWG